MEKSTICSSSALIGGKAPDDGTEIDLEYLVTIHEPPLSNRKCSTPVSLGGCDK